jgi:hypothetical protein
MARSSATGSKQIHRDRPRTHLPHLPSNHRLTRSNSFESTLVLLRYDLPTLLVASFAESARELYAPPVLFDSAEASWVPLVESLTAPGFSPELEPCASPPCGEEWSLLFLFNLTPYPIGIDPHGGPDDSAASSSPSSLDAHCGT